MSSPSVDHHDWTQNYFNYFTEVEEHFQRTRGTALFLLSPLDWALLETWKNSGVPLEAVLRGIDAAFEKWRSRKQKGRMVNSIAYCAQAVMAEAQRMADQGAASGGGKTAAAPFTGEALARYLRQNAAALRESAVESVRAMAAALEEIAEHAEEQLGKLEELEQRLTAMEEKMLAALKVAQSEEQLLAIRRDLDAQLRPYRGKMSAPQLRQLEDQYVSGKLLEQAGLPRLSLFYMTDYGG